MTTTVDCPAKASCRRTCTSECKIELEPEVYDDDEGGHHVGYCYQCHPAEPFFIPLDAIPDVTNVSPVAPAKSEEEIRETENAESMCREILAKLDQPVIVGGFSPQGREEAVQIANTKKPERGFFTDRNLSVLFGAHPNTIANWRNGRASPPEGFTEALQNKDEAKMRSVAEKYKASRNHADAMGTRSVCRGMSEEQIYREGGNPYSPQ